MANTSARELREKIATRVETSVGEWDETENSARVGTVVVLRR